MTQAKDLPEAHKGLAPGRSDNGESDWVKISREAYVFGGGAIGGAIKEGIQATVERPKETAVGAAESVGIGVALTMAKAGPLPVKLLGAAAGAYFTYGTAKWLATDVLKPDRWKDLNGAWSDTWQSSAHTEKNFSTVQGSLGRLSFDTALMVGGGALGAKIGGLGLKFSERPVSERPTPAPEVKAVEPAKALSPREIQTVLQNIGERNPGPESSLSKDQLQAVAFAKRDNIDLGFDAWKQLSDIPGKAGWQIQTVATHHANMSDSAGNLRPEMFDRLETAWKLRDAFDKQTNDDLRLEGSKDPRSAQVFLLDGVKSKEELADYARIYQPAMLTFLRNRPAERLGPHVAEFARLPFIKEMDNTAIRSAFHHYVLTGEKPVDAASIQTTKDMHYLDPTLPSEQAAHFQTNTPKEQLTAVAAWNALLAEKNIQRLEGGVIAVEDRPKVDWSNPDVRAAYDKHYAALEQQGRGAIVSNLTYTGRFAVEQATQLVHGNTLTEHQLEELSNAFLEESVNPFRVIGTVKPARFQEALQITSDEEARLFNPGAPALKLAVIFKGSTGDWIAKQAKLGRNLHDAVYWLPLDEPAKLAGLDNFLFANAAKPLPELEMIAGRWSKLSQEDRQMPFADLLFKVRSESYARVQHPQFAAEASQWGIKQEDYEGFEQRFVASLDTPSPFPLDKTWASGGLTGRFLPRSDTRGLFLGQFTNCCQHPRAEGKTAAWHGQESPQAGFFVVEDAAHQIVAQSFAWISEKGGLVFDNVEAKGLGKREPAVQNIYQDASTELAKKFGVVTLGTRAGDMRVNRWSLAEQLSQPLLDNGIYTDAFNQVLLAKDDAVMAKQSKTVGPIGLQYRVEGLSISGIEPRTFTSPLRLAQSTNFLSTSSGISFGTPDVVPHSVRFTDETDE